MLKREVSIGNKKVGDGNKCLIVAEAGGNHNLVLAQALKLIDIAADSAADVVKFSLSRAHMVYPPNAGTADYLGLETSIYDIVKAREVPYEWVPKLKSYAENKGLIYLSSSFDNETTDVLADNNVSAYKIASYEATHIPLIKHVASKQKPIILSVGVTTLNEIRLAIETILAQGNDQVILMHCVGSYPAPIEDANLSVIQKLKDEFGCPVGLSDHSRNPSLLPSCAVTLGANIIEKHFTISNLLPGADHSFAVEPKELQEMVTSIRQAELALGSPDKNVAGSEKELYDFARRSIFTVKKLNKGDVITEKDIRVLRNGKQPSGLMPKYYEKILGKKVLCDLTEFHSLQPSDLDVVLD